MSENASCDPSNTDPNLVDETLAKLHALQDDQQQALERTKRAIASILGNNYSPESVAKPPCRAVLLHDFLKETKQQVPVVDVPRILTQLGHVSNAVQPTTNWLYQLPDYHDFFVVTGGMVTLKPEFTDSED